MTTRRFVARSPVDTGRDLSLPTGTQRCSQGSCVVDSKYDVDEHVTTCSALLPWVCQVCGLRFGASLKASAHAWRDHGPEQLGGRGGDDCWYVRRDDSTPRELLEGALRKEHERLPQSKMSQLKPVESAGNANRAADCLTMSGGKSPPHGVRHLGEATVNAELDYDDDVIQLTSSPLVPAECAASPSGMDADAGAENVMAKSDAEKAEVLLYQSYAASPSRQTGVVTPVRVSTGSVQEGTVGVMGRPLSIQEYKDVQCPTMREYIARTSWIAGRLREVEAALKVSEEGRRVAEEARLAAKLELEKAQLVRGVSRNVWKG